MEETGLPPSRDPDDPIREMLEWWSKVQAIYRKILPLDSIGASTTQSKLSGLAERHTTWGVVGMLLGAINSPWAKYMICGSWIVLVVAIWKVNFSKGPSKQVEIGANIFLSALVGFALIGFWHVIPKPPTIEEEATAIAARMPHPTDKETIKQPESSESDRASEIAALVLKKLPPGPPHRLGYPSCPMIFCVPWSRT